MAKNRLSVDRQTIKHFWWAQTLFKKELAFSWLTGFSGLGITIIVPYFIGKILGSLANPSIDIKPDVYGLIIATIMTFLLNRIGFNNYLSMQPKAQAYLQTEVLEALLKRGTSFHNNRVSGKLVSDAIDYPNAYNQLSSAFFTEVYPFSLSIIIGITLIFIHSVTIGIVIVVMTAIMIASVVRFRLRMKPFRIERQEASKALISHEADTLVNVQTVKSFGNEHKELKQHAILNDILLNARLRDWHAFAKDGSYRVLGLLLFQILFVLVVAHQVHNNPALLATGIFAFSYTVSLSNRLFQIGAIMRNIEEALLLAMPMTEMLQEQVEIQDLPDAKELKTTSGKIAFRNVTFHYTDNPKHDAVFASLSLGIKPGEKVGLVGPSGGGKTTLTKLLLRFEDIQDGKILIDNQNIADVTQASLRKSISYVPQEPLLFHRSIRENIGYGNPLAHQADIENAASQAHADEFIVKLPNGYDTVVGERGVKLSGGQRQRVAIARAILKDAPILLLDEATSALDSESEVAIQAALWELMQDRTTVVVAHRLSTIQRMDRIVVLNDGRIVEQGTHTELLKNNGLYAKLWKHQSGGFLEE